MKGSRHDVVNYRPLGITSNLYKLYERCCAINMRRNLRNNPNQTGFRPGFSIHNLLMRLEAVIRLCEAENTDLVIVGIDFKEAYERAWRPGILYQLWHAGITGKLWRIIRDMLTDTTSCVRTNFGDTRTFRTRVGIIQGSVLAASLFAVYISPISDELASLSSAFNSILFPPQLYADDMEALARRLLQAEQLSRAAIQWASKWGSEVGITKSNLVLIMANLAAPTTPAPPLTLKAVNSTDILGVKLSKEGLAPCNFVAPLISKLHKKIQAVFAAIGGLSTTVKPIIAVYLYQTYAFSSMKHILPLAAHNSKTLTALQAAQNTFTQRTLQSDSSSSYILLDAELGLIDIDIQASKERILMFYRALKNPQDTLAPAILSFPTRENGVTARQELQNLISFLGINIALNTPFLKKVGRILRNIYFCHLDLTVQFSLHKSVFGMNRPHQST